MRIRRTDLAARRYDPGMRLTPTEEDRLLIFSAAELARSHRARGILLNAPEVVALVCDAMHLAARSGGDYEAVVVAGRAAVDRADVLDGVSSLLREIRVEVVLEEGTRLVVLVDPLGPGPDMVTGLGR
jgi:urease subunit gamma/beta